MHQEMSSGTGSRINYTKYAKRTLNQAHLNPHVDETDFEQVSEYTEDIAELIIVDEEKLKQEVLRIAQSHRLKQLGF
jgi:hypothetical protein